MERKRNIITMLLFFLMLNALNASNKTDIYQAYISNNMVAWQKTIDNMQLQKSKSDDFRVELINYQYGYIAWCIGNNQKDLARKYLDIAENNLAILKKWL